MNRFIVFFFFMSFPLWAAEEPAQSQRDRGYLEVQQQIVESDYAKILLEITGELPSPYQGGEAYIKDRYSESGLGRFRYYLRKTLEIYGYDQVFYEDVPHRRSWFNGFASRIDGINYYVEIPGSNPELGIVEITAHYDSTGPGMPGANDNGTGVAAVLSMAGAFKMAGIQPVRTLRFVFFDLEEVGLVGSDLHYDWVRRTGNPVVAMINFDMIGNAPETIPTSIFDTHGNQPLHRFIMETMHSEQFMLEPWGPFASDSASARDHGIPSVSFAENPHKTDHKGRLIEMPYDVNNHELTDTYDKINTEYAILVTRKVTELIWRISNSDVTFIPEVPTKKSWFQSDERGGGCAGAF